MTHQLTNGGGLRMRIGLTCKMLLQNAGQRHGQMSRQHRHDVRAAAHGANDSGGWPDRLTVNDSAPVVRAAESAHSSRGDADRRPVLPPVQGMRPQTVRPLWNIRDQE